jgi:hypothetical protein
MKGVSMCCGAPVLEEEESCESYWAGGRVVERWIALTCEECGDPLDDDQVVDPELRLERLGLPIE